MFYLKNLTSTETHRGKPWEFTSLELVPEKCRGKDGKPARTEWITNPNTDFHVYSMFEGVNPNARVKAPVKDNEGNPVVYMHGLAVDYDTPFDPVEFQRGLDRIEDKSLHPNWVEITLSGNFRLIWLFKEPLPIPAQAFAVGL